VHIKSLHIIIIIIIKLSVIRQLIFITMMLPVSAAETAGGAASGRRARPTPWSADSVEASPSTSRQPFCSLAPLH